MTGMRARALIRLAGLVVGLAATASVRGEGVAVGVARIDVTPAGRIWLSGYAARTAESTGVAHPIHAKALAIGADDQKPVVLVSVDNVGVSDAIVGEVAERLRRKVGLPRERLAVGASHTHSAPVLAGVLPNIFGKPVAPDAQARIDAYTREFVDKLEKVCLDALAARKPAMLSWAQGKVGFAANRRTPGGPVDHALPVLKAAGPDGKVRAIVANYACHCTTIDPAENLVDGDWAGAAQREIEADNPGCIAMTVVGCGADSNPKPRVVKGQAEAHGRALADEVARLMRGPWKPVSGPPVAAMERFTLPYDTLPTRAELESIAAAGGHAGQNAKLQLDHIRRDGKLPAALPYSAQAWRFGDDLLMVFLPGEVVVDYVLRIKKEFDPSRTWVTAYTNDVPCYVPSERILREGGYEGGGAMIYYGRPTRLKAGVEQLILDAVHRVAGPGFAPPAKQVQAGDDERPPALSPEEALRTFQIKPGLKVELVAAEPLIESPVAVDFGPDGRLWVCEMFDYPAGVDGKYKPGGRVKVLEDRDRDGRYETSTVFLDGLPFPTGVTCWRNGVLVCAAPEILYAEDTDGDGKADVRRTLYQGFATENYQARVNGLSYNLDGWVYGANGLIGGRIHGRADGREVDLGSRDFRFKPDLGVFEPAAGVTQQGRVHDDWGNQFGGNNSILIQHYPLPEHYVRRNPRVPAPSPAVYPHGDADPGRLFPASRTLARFNEPDNANRVTSACSPLVHRDPLLGDAYMGNGFTCEPVHNLVRRIVLEPEGATFAGGRAADEQDREFLASTDSWFRPVQVRTGPDGALWVVDMYRFVIEHPRWISPEKLATLDVRAGADRGRIYRIVPEGRPLRPVANLAAMGPADLAAAMDTPNGTVRDTVQRLLDHRRDRAAGSVLEKIARTSRYPAARAQALAALEVLGLLDGKSAPVVFALKDEHPEVRRNALRVAESRLAGDAAVARSALALADDPDAGVRYQVALSLGAWASPQAGEALGRIAARDGNDGWSRAAVLSSATAHARSILERLIAAAGPGGPPGTLVGPLIATLAGKQDREVTASTLRLIAQAGPAAAWRLAAFAELLDAAKDDSLASAPEAAPLIEAARKTVAAGGSPVADRIAALRLLGRGEASRDADRAAIAALLEPVEPIEVQAAALRSLLRRDDPASAGAVVDRWGRLGPAVRTAAIDALLSRDATADVLLAAIEAGRVPPSQIAAEQRERLLRSGPEPRRSRAAVAFGSLRIGARKDVLTAYAVAKTTAGDAVKGREVFRRTCAVCHKLEGIGTEVGPDLAALTDLSPDALLVAILDPNREVDARYVTYNAALKDGRTLSGLIAGETASAIMLKRQEGATDTVLRDDLEEFVSSGRSLMPEGLENDVSPRDAADLIAFLAKGASRPKSLEGNRPEVVKAGPGGVIRLTAANAEIYGPSLTFETEYANLGFWHSAADHAAWTFEVGHGSMFRVVLDYACADESAGNAYKVFMGQHTVRGVVAGTGGWSHYVQAPMTSEVFHRAVHRIELRPDGPPRGALADVRAILLIPSEAADADAPAATSSSEPREMSVEDAAKTILDPASSDAVRADVIARLADRSASLIAALVHGLDGADEAEQYRRIPWIWRVAIAAGRRNDAEEMKRILEMTLPAHSPRARLDDWRAVVIGGGLINGVSMAGPLPGPRFDEVLKASPALNARWEQAVDLAVRMADDESVRKGTRYDALRMLGVRGWDAHGEQLVRYLARGVDPELHQGAVCALGDIPSTRVVAPLLEALSHLSPANREFAERALVRDAGRREALSAAIRAGRIRPESLGESVRKVLAEPAGAPTADAAPQDPDRKERKAPGR